MTIKLNDHNICFLFEIMVIGLNLAFIKDILNILNFLIKLNMFQIFSIIFTYEITFQKSFWKSKMYAYNMKNIIESFTLCWWKIQTEFNIFIWNHICLNLILKENLYSVYLECKSNLLVSLVILMTNGFNWCWTVKLWCQLLFDIIIKSRCYFSQRFK